MEKIATYDQFTFSINKYFSKTNKRIIDIAYEIFLNNWQTNTINMYKIQIILNQATMVVKYDFKEN